MNKILSRFRHDFTVIIAGFQETMISIADHVNQSVQKVKNDLASAELEKEINGSQICLGKLIYAYPKTSPEDSRDNFVLLPAVKSLIEKIDSGKKNLDGITAIVSPREALNDFEHLLIRSDFVIQHVIITDEFKGIGEVIRDLGLPDRMLIFFIKKNKGIEIVGGGVVIEVKDEITFLCSKENTNKYIDFWR